MGGILSQLPRPAIYRVLRDMLLDDLRRSRGSRFDGASLYRETRIQLDSEGVGLDSLERFGLASRINDFFALHRSGVEDNLLRARSLEDMVDVVRAGLDSYAGEIVFASGGTVAAPRLHRHSVATLEEEVAELARLFAGRRRVIVTVPVHHIYGFLFGVLLPLELDVPVFQARWSLLGGDGRPGKDDLVLAVPFLWQQFAGVHHQWETGYWGVSSTAPMPDDLAGVIAAGPAASFIEVYGSSETAGIGWRDHCVETTPGFSLFPWWEAAPGNGTLRRRPQGDVVALPDTLEWIHQRRLLPRGRRDAVVQVGGHNVDLTLLRQRIIQGTGVEDCAVRINGQGRIVAFLVTPADRQNPDAGPGATEEAVVRAEGWLTESLADHERPVEVRWGAQLPRNDLGKLAPW